ncbi:MAG: hypothetical protein ISS92_00090 [Candidatus Omnitrophica bacterium]|nr:hypothetical protein [Candidatus Omnitrophota bacterium]
MRIFILTQEEPFYLPTFFQHLFERNKEIVGLGIGKRHNVSFLKMALRHYDFLGPKEFMMHSLLAINYKIKDMLSHAKEKRFYSVKKVAKFSSIPVFPVQNVNSDDFIYVLKNKIKPDLIVSIAFSQKLRDSVIKIPKHGCINLHSGKLPHYRGMLPTFWALVNNEKTTAVTLHYINEKIDQGNIIVQLDIDIDHDDTLCSLLAKNKLKGLDVLIMGIDCIRRGRVKTIKNDPSDGSYFSFPTKKDRICFKRLGKKFR